MEKVSVIIVARNEAKVIVRCIEAAKAAVAEIGGARIFVADSASTDDTVSLARAAGATVLELKPDWDLSASAGRYIGTHFAESEYLLFVDADTEVYKGFLPKALAEFEAKPRLAGICGYLDDRNEGEEKVLNIEKRFDEIADIDWLRGGCCFYRRSAVLEVGSFNPYLKNEEEADLCIRLKRANWQLEMIPVPMAVHTRCSEDLSGKSLVTHISQSVFSQRFGGLTRTIAYAFRGGYGIKFCHMRVFTTFLFIAWLFSAIFGWFVPMFHVAHMLNFGVLLIGFLAAVIRKRSIKKAFIFFVSKFLGVASIFYGLSKITFKDPSAYPTDIGSTKDPADIAKCAPVRA